MKYLKISKSAKLIDLTTRIGYKNVEGVLHLNRLDRMPNIGNEFDQKCKAAIAETSIVNWEKKKVILNTLTDNSDVFECASLLGQSGWKLLASDMNTLPGYLRIPDNVRLSNTVDVLGDNTKVKKSIFDKVMAGLEGQDHDIDPAAFGYYDTRPINMMRSGSRSSSVGAMKYFKIPWGKVSLYSSLAADYVDFPCYPESMQDIIRANYGQMPDMLYQYEPWMVYNSSGPIVNTYTFDIHRDMWDDHTNGKAAQLVRFCEANCYPRYNGSAVHTATVKLYINGQVIINGILTEVSVDWDGPLGLDGYYLHFKISLTIQEISEEPLNYDVVRNKSLIG